MFTVIPGLSGFIFLVALGVTLLVCANGLWFGVRLRVLSYPDQSRRRHKAATPQVGGIAIILGLIIWLGVTLLLDGARDRNFLLAILFCVTGVGALGFADDQNEISPFARILLLLVFMGVAFTIEPRFVASKLNWESFQPTAIPLWAYIPLMGATSVGLVNAVNMADGQNGIVGGLYAVWAACLLIATGGASAALAGVILALVLVFLVFNLSGKIFLGDCGSYGVTFVLGLMVAFAHARNELSLDVIIVWFFIPVMDCVRLLIGRTIRGGSPFEGDRDHFHHRLEDKVGKVPGLITYVGTVAISSIVATAAPRFALVCLCVLCAFYFSFAWLTDTNALSELKFDSDGEDKVVPMRDTNRRNHAS